MDQIFKYIKENDDCQFLFQELRNILSTGHISDEKTLKSRLLSHYGDNIVLSTHTIIYFKKTPRDIVR
jgi:hypothetical protein